LQVSPIDLLGVERSPIKNPRGLGGCLQPFRELLSARLKGPIDQKSEVLIDYT
jgi:hypothetical protein